jgi:hypothetical protein
MPNSHVTSDREVPDAFVFCTSLAQTRALKTKFQYDSRFKIISPLNFASLVFDALRDNFNVVGYVEDKVKYGVKIYGIANDNQKPLLDNINQSFEEYCFKKPIGYKDEHEYRIVFVLGDEKPIQPFEITCPELLKYCVF